MSGETTLRIETDEKSRRDTLYLVKFLDFLLSKEYILLAKIRSYHRGFNGHDIELQAVLDLQKSGVADIAEDIAQRGRSLGSDSFRTMKDFFDLAEIKQEQGASPGEYAVRKDLLAQHESILSALQAERQAHARELQDSGIESFLLNIMQSHHKMAAMFSTAGGKTNGH